jgi:hypothetical protein
MWEINKTEKIVANRRNSNPPFFIGTKQKEVQSMTEPANESQMHVLQTPSFLFTLSGKNEFLLHSLHPIQIIFSLGP